MLHGYINSVRTPLLCDKIANDDENFGKCSGTL